MIETAQVFGVDIGGSGIKAAPVNLEKGEFAEPRLKILTPRNPLRRPLRTFVRQQLEHFEVPETRRPVSRSRRRSSPASPLISWRTLTSLGLAWTSPRNSPRRAVVRWLSSMMLTRRVSPSNSSVRKGPGRFKHRDHARHVSHRSDLRRRAHPEYRAGPYRTAERQGRRGEVRGVVRAGRLI